MRSRLIIDLDALAANYAALKAAAAGAEVAPVLKADGYGLGAGPIVRRLWAEGARSFFVANIGEGEALRGELAGREARIYVIDGDGAPERFPAAKLTPVLNTPDQVRAWNGANCAWHVDTGMNRLGLTLEEVKTLSQACPHPALFMSHLGSAADPEDARNGAQLERFLAAKTHLPAARASLSASAGAYLGAKFRFDMVRPGISLFGGGPREVPDERIAAVATLEAPILQFRNLKAGERAGYGTTYSAPRDVRIAVLAAGYADGIIRKAHEGAKAFAGGKPAPICFVTMDLIGVDVSGIESLSIGDHVELLGPNALLDDLAAACGSVAHECLTRLGPRSQKIYKGTEG